MRLHNYLIYENTDEDQHIENILNILKKDCKPFLKEIRDSSKLLYRGVDSLDYTEIIKKKVRKNRKPKDTKKETQKLVDEIFMEIHGVKPRSNGVFVTGSKDNATEYGNPYLFFPIGSYKFIWSPKIFDLYSGFLEEWEYNYDNIDDDGYIDEYEDDYKNDFGPMNVWKYGDREYDKYEYDREDIIDYITQDLGEKFIPSKLKSIKKYSNSDIEKYVKSMIEKEKRRKIDDLKIEIKDYKMNGIIDAIKKGHEIMFMCDEYYLVDASYKQKIIKSFK